ncbi:MAG: tyrosine-type recombinase/integrase [Thermaurantiacus tibetensis]
MGRRLSARRVKTAGEGWHFDGVGSGLALRVRGNGRSWVLRVRMDDRQRDIGLGRWPDVSLAMARQRATEMRRAIAEGRDPVAERRAARAVPTLAQALDAWIAKEAPGWKGGAQGHTARATPRLFARHLPALMGRRVNRIDEKAIVAALAPVWIARQETARKLMERLRGTLRLAKAQGHCGGIDWEEVAEALPSVRREVAHHGMLPLAEVPGFWRHLAARDTWAARALAFVLLTACRSGEARGAEWAEIDPEAGLWTIPASRMKARREHLVPLSKPALALLERCREEGQALHPDCPLLFPSPATGKPLRDVALARLLREAGHKGATVHGFRSAFRSWAAETGASREAAEACLAHAPEGGAVERAYQRAAMIERKRSLLDAWADFVTGEAEAGRVVPLRGVRLEAGDCG